MGYQRPEWMIPGAEEAQNREAPVHMTQTVWLDKPQREKSGYNPLDFLPNLIGVQLLSNQVAPEGFLAI